MDIEKRTLKVTENVKEIMTRNVLALEKVVSVQTQETFRIPIRKEKTKTSKQQQNTQKRNSLDHVVTKTLNIKT